jgi:beta-glucosidase
MSKLRSRRHFIAGAAATLSAMPFGDPSLANSETGTMSRTPAAPNNTGEFPVGFQWGTATAAYQIEGSTKVDGRGASIWDTFTRKKGATEGGATGDGAAGSYRRYAQDIALMKGLGATTCRFSIAWPRIFPSGRGQANPKGIEHYRRFAEALLAAGIEPFCTLYHWDLPQALQDAGGWQNPDTARAFADYAGYCASQLGDVIRNFMTMNEISTFMELGYGNGSHAPGLKLSRSQLAQACHYAVLGHGLAVQAIRSMGPRGLRIGFAENLWPATPIVDSPDHVAAARRAMIEENARYLTAMMTGRYTDAYLTKLGPDAPKFTDSELRAIASPTDFQGFNIYTPSWIRAADTPLGYSIIEDPASYPHMLSSWLTIGPESMYWTPKLASEVFRLTEIYITENGTSAQDVVAPDGHIYDTDRIMYLRNYLLHLQRATTEGVPIKGYFLWSLLDNFEWSYGYGKRFGITYVDFDTQRRTPKFSSRFYAQVIKQNRVS